MVLLSPSMNLPSEAPSAPSSFEKRGILGGWTYLFFHASFTLIFSLWTQFDSATTSLTKVCLRHWQTAYGILYQTAQVKHPIMLLNT